jgi:hypothetical protein
MRQVAQWSVGLLARVLAGETPPWSYRPPHPTARMFPEDGELIRRWLGSAGRDQQGGTRDD